MSSPEASGIPVMTLGQFRARGGYDVEISHDRLRFPNGISKRQARDNRRAAGHHLHEAFRSAADYQDAIARGEIRAPTDAEQAAERIVGHPDHESVKATWRVRVRRQLRADPSATLASVVEAIIREHMDGSELWVDELGLTPDSPMEKQVEARLRWMGLALAAAA